MGRAVHTEPIGVCRVALTPVRLLPADAVGVMAGTQCPFSRLCLLGGHGRALRVSSCLNRSRLSGRDRTVYPKVRSPDRQTPGGEQGAEEPDPGGGASVDPTCPSSVALTHRGHITRITAAGGLTYVPRAPSSSTSLVPGHGPVEANSRPSQRAWRPSDGRGELGQHVRGSKPRAEDTKGSDVQTPMQAF